MAEELFNVYDENNNPTGVVKPRAAVHRDGDWHRTTHIYLANAKGEILVHLRSPFKDASPNKWDPRFGGHLKSGDTYEKNAVDELQQEIGLKVGPQDLEPGDLVRHDGGKNREHIQTYIYRFSGDVGNLKFNDNEVVEVRWMLPEAIVEEREKQPEKWGKSWEGFDEVVEKIKGST